MKISHKPIFLISLCLLVLTCCFPDQWHGIKVSNKSQFTIYIYGEYILPDTILSLEKPALKEIRPNESTHLFDNDINDIELTRFETEKLTIFVLNKDTVDKYPWEDIRSKYQILKRYEINKLDIINLGGFVNYP